MYKTLIRYPRQFLPQFSPGKMIVIDDVQFTVTNYREMPKQSYGYKNHNIAGILFMQSNTHGVDVVAKVKIGRRCSSLYFDNPILKK